MQLIAKTDFSWAHRGVEIERFEAGQEFETEDADLISVATSEGWAEIAGQKADAPAENKARTKRETK
jgi:hypothetical protein